MLDEGIITICEEFVYYADWKISNIVSKRHRSPVFYPIPKVELGFCFEIWNQENSFHQSAFRLILHKILCIDIPEGLEMNLKIVTYGESTRSNLNGYHSSAPIIVKQMSSIDILNSDYLTEEVRNTYLNNGTLKGEMKFIKSLNFPFGNHLDSRRASNLDNFAEDFFSIYSPCVLNDVQFKVENTTLNAHKSVLSAHSPVFLKMFTQDCLESTTNSVTIADTTANNFESFLKYLYSGKIEDNSLPNLMELFVLADKFDIRTLKRECAENAATLLSVENIFEILVIVYGSVEQEEIQASVKKFAASNIKLLLAEEKWNELVKSHPVIAYEVMAEVQRISESSI